MSLKVPFIDLHEQYKRYRKKIDVAIFKVLKHGYYVNGPEIAELEQKLAEFVGVKHCIAVSSGTTALQVIMMALQMAPGDEIIVPDFSFFATAEVPMLLGLRPVFVDINPQTYNIDPQAVRRAMTDKTRAILPVSLYGQAAELAELVAIAKEYDVALVEDAAQSLGARSAAGLSASMGTAAATSFFPSKALGAYGDAGACFCTDDELAERIRIIRCHGESSRYHHSLLGVNARMASIQAAVLLVKLEQFSSEIAQRQECAQRYNELLDGIVPAPFIMPGYESVYAQYTIAVDHRDQVAAKLLEHGIPTAIHYPQTMHQQEIVKKSYPYLAEDINNPHAEAAADRVLSLPFGPWVKTADQKLVAKALREVLGE